MSTVQPHKLRAVRAPAERPQNMPITPRESIAGHRFSYNRHERHCGGGVSLTYSRQTPLLGHRRGHARARAVPRSSPLFAQRPRSTWVSLQTARQVVKTTMEELRARPVHMGSLVRCGCALRTQAGQTRTGVVRARTHTSTRAQRCLRSVHTQLAQLPYPPAPPPTRPPFVTCDLPFNAVSDS